MAINEQRAKQRGVSEDGIAEIEAIHEEIEELMASCGEEEYHGAVYNHIEALEFILQDLWGFSLDATNHTWKHLYKFRCLWVGRKFKRLTTGEVLVIPDKIYPKDCLSFGEAGLDLGILDGYYRMNNCEEMT